MDSRIVYLCLFTSLYFHCTQGFGNGKFRFQQGEAHANAIAIDEVFRKKVRIKKP